MIIVNSVNNIPIRLSQERWNHIVHRHPEMENQKDQLLETLKKPDKIQEGDFETLLAIRFFDNTPLTSKFLVVVYKEIKERDGFVLTAYYTTRPSERRKVIWRQ